MGDLNEIVTVDAAGRLFAFLAVALPVLGIVIGAAVGSRTGSLRNGALRGLVVGLIGPLNFLLWRIYNAITDRNGLDTVRNLVINVVVFVAVGIAIGLLLSRRRA